MRRAARRDDNHAAVRDALRAAGIWTHDTGGMGDGFPDLLCWFRGTFHLLEVKDGTKPPSKRALTDDEAEFIRTCPGQVHVVNSVAEAFEALGVKAGFA
jgi:hypothetical protein